MDNYFDIFELPQQFEINKKLLKQNFNQQISTFHPDKFSNKSSKEQVIAAKNTSLLNTAFKTLDSDLLRATYLLELQSINAFDEKNTKMNMNFLAHTITLRETLETLENDIEIDDFIDRINEEIRKYINSITQEFNKNNLDKVTNLVRELKFYTQIKYSAIEKLT